MTRFRLALLLAAATLSSAVAAPPDIGPGEFVRGGDTGTLVIRRDAQGTLRFDIESTGANCHQCGVSGVIRGNTGYADGDGSPSQCRIAFSGNRSAVAVEPSTEEECREFCGARAGFDGSYAVPPPACTRDARQALRDRALASYRSRRYAQAAGALQGLLAQCGAFMHWIETDRVRNDLALSQYRAGEREQCLETLKSTLAAEFRDEEELRRGGPRIYLPPCDFDNYVEVAKATWFNRALCTKAATGKR